MPLAGIVTLIGAVLTVAALAFYLIRIAVYLREVSFNVGTIVAGLWAIAQQTEPLYGVMNDINGSLSNTEAGLQEVLDRSDARRRRAGGGQRTAAAPEAGSPPGGQGSPQKKSAPTKTAAKKATKKKQAKKSSRRR